MEVEQNITDTTKVLLNIGFNINNKKSVFNPTQKLEHLGFVTDFISMTVSLTDHKVIQLKKSFTNILNDSSGVLTVQTLLEFLGNLEF